MRRYSVRSSAAHSMEPINEYEQYSQKSPIDIKLEDYLEKIKDANLKLNEMDYDLTIMFQTFDTNLFMISGHTNAARESDDEWGTDDEGSDDENKDKDKDEDEDEPPKGGAKRKSKKKKTMKRRARVVAKGHKQRGGGLGKLFRMCFGCVPRGTIAPVSEVLPISHEDMQKIASAVETIADNPLFAPEQKQEQDRNEQQLNRNFFVKGEDKALEILDEIKGLWVYLEKHDDGKPLVQQNVTSVCLRDILLACKSIIQYQQRFKPSTFRLDSTKTACLCKFESSIEIPKMGSYTKSFKLIAQQVSTRAISFYVYASGENEWVNLDKYIQQFGSSVITAVKFYPVYTGSSTNIEALEELTKIIAKQIEKRATSENPHPSAIDGDLLPETMEDGLTFASYLITTFVSRMIQRVSRELPVK